MLQSISSCAKHFAKKKKIIDLLLDRTDKRTTLFLHFKISCLVCLIVMIPYLETQLCCICFLLRAFFNDE